VPVEVTRPVCQCGRTLVMFGLMLIRLSQHDDLQLIFDLVIRIHSCGGHCGQFLCVKGTSTPSQGDRMKPNVHAEITNYDAAQLLDEVHAAISFRTGSWLTSHATLP